jgi:hypothetical protein
MITGIDKISACDPILFEMLFIKSMFFSCKIQSITTLSAPEFITFVAS